MFLKLSLFLFLGVAVMLGVTKVVPQRYGDQVGARFLERNPEYNTESLTAWVKDQGAAARAYAFPVLFPLDLLFMVFLAAFLAVASVGLAGSVDRLAGLAWLFVLVPALYLGADLAEDALLARFLLAPNSIMVGTVRAAQTLTTIKIWSLWTAGAQLMLLGLMALLYNK